MESITAATWSFFKSPDTSAIKLAWDEFALGRVAPFGSSALASLSFLAPLRNTALQYRNPSRCSTAKLVSFVLSFGFSGSTFKKE